MRMIATVTSIIVEAAKPWPRFCARNRCQTYFRRYLRGDAGSAAGLGGDHEVVKLDDARGG